MTGKSSLLYEGHLGRITTLVYSPDGALLASGAEYEMAIRLWNSATLELRAIFKLGEPFWDVSSVAIAFSRDGKTLYGGAHNCVLRAWEIETGKILWERDCGPYQIELSPNGEVAALNGFRTHERFCKLLDLRTNRFLKFSLPEGQWAGEFSENGVFLLTFSDHDEEAPLWQMPHFFRGPKWRSVESPLPIGLNKALGFTVFEGKTAVIFTRQWTEDSTEPAFPHIYDITSGQLLAKFRPTAPQHYEFETDSLAVIPHTRHVISRRIHSQTQIEDIDNPNFKVIVEPGPSYDTQLCPSRDGRAVAIGDNSGAVRLINVGSGRIERLGPNTTPISGLAATPNGRYLACLRSKDCDDPQESSGYKVWLWDLAELHLAGQMTCSEREGIFQAAVEEGIVLYEPVSKTLVFRDSDSESRRERAFLIVRREGRPREALRASFTLSTDARWLVHYKASSLLEVFDLNSMQTAYEVTLTASTTYPYGIAISEDGSKLAIGLGFTEGSNALLFDRHRRGMPRDVSFWDSVDALAFRPDGQALALNATYLPRIAVVSADRRRKRSYADGHVQPARSLLYTPDGRYLVSGGADGQIILWDAQSLRREKTLMILDSGEASEWAVLDEETILKGSKGVESRFRLSS